jgi:hypothetical protein
MADFNERQKAILAKAEQAFKQKKEIDNLWQSIAEQFYPERADFVMHRNLSDEFADHLSTSTPLVFRRDLGDSIGGMLRPRGQDWFKVSVNKDASKIDLAGQAYLEAVTKTQRRAMYDRPAQFTKATKEADHDYAAFGQCVLSAEINLAATSLLYRCWHLKDMAWCENEYGEIDFIVRKWETDCANAYRYFKGKVHKKVEDKVTKQAGAKAYEKACFWHIIVKANAFDYVDGDYSEKRFPWVSLWVDKDNKFVMEESPRQTSYYIIPRWTTPGNHPYAYSPASIAGLADGRLIQAMTYTLLRAGEKAVDPPMVATHDVIKSDIANYPSGITWADLQGVNGSLEDAIMPIPQDHRMLPIGLQLQQSQIALLQTAFYINKLSMPPVTVEMTAEEARYRVQQYIRQALPLFEPIEQEYNTPLCENTFELLQIVNAFGPKGDVPESLSNADVEFRFESPLIEARDQELARTFMDTKALIVEAMALDPGSQYVLNTDTALREAIRGRQAPATWMRTPEDAAGEVQKAQQRLEGQKAMQDVAMGGAAAEQAGRGIGTLQAGLAGGETK